MVKLLLSLIIFIVVLSTPQSLFANQEDILAKIDSLSFQLFLSIQSLNSEYDPAVLDLTARLQRLKEEYQRAKESRVAAYLSIRNQRKSYINESNSVNEELQKAEKELERINSALKKIPNQIKEIESEVLKSMRYAIVKNRGENGMPDVTHLYDSPKDFLFYANLLTQDTEYLLKLARSYGIYGDEAVLGDYRRAILIALEWIDEVNLESIGIKLSSLNWANGGPIGGQLLSAEVLKKAKVLATKLKSERESFADDNINRKFIETMTFLSNLDDAIIQIVENFERVVLEGQVQMIEVIERQKRLRREAEMVHKRYTGLLAQSRSSSEQLKEYRISTKPALADLESQRRNAGEILKDIQLLENRLKIFKGRSAEWTQIMDSIGLLRNPSCSNFFN